MSGCWLAGGCCECDRGCCEDGQEQHRGKGIIVDGTEIAEDRHLGESPRGDGAAAHNTAGTSVLLLSRQPDTRRELDSS